MKAWSQPITLFALVYKFYYIKFTTPLAFSLIIIEVVLIIGKNKIEVGLCQKKTKNKRVMDEGLRWLLIPTDSLVATSLKVSKSLLIIDLNAFALNDWQSQCNEKGKVFYCPPATSTYLSFGLDR